VIPPLPPHSDVRTPEYVVFDDVQRKPWECVRGMDHSFGYNRASRPEAFIERAELLWMLTDIAAKGGNLLLNVGPRGVDAQIPDEQITRLDWLGEWVRPHADAIMGTRPWVTPGTTTHEGEPIRYTTRDDTVYAITPKASATITLPDVAATPTTAIMTITVSVLGWKDTAAGIEVDATPSAGDDPSVFALHDVAARASR
jgi:alpha-L-fucosidase